MEDITVDADVDFSNVAVFFEADTRATSKSATTPDNGKRPEQMFGGASAI